MTRIYLLLFLIFFSTGLFAQFTQSIRGTVLDEASTNTIAYATIAVLNSDPLIGTVADSAGNFKITDLPVGRYDLRVTLIGYEPAIVREITVSSAQQTVITVRMKEKISQLGEVVIRPKVNKSQPINSMATVSAKMLSVEEAKRYAGGFDDPARLATATAGVGGNTSYNGIIVRGNAPKFLQWKMEGIEIPNPNHFADLNALGGGTLTALSTQMLANSDFLTGAFPAEYNNAISGVFDINIRTGNNQKREHTLQAGIIGLDVSSEGPFKKGGQSSYLFNYRYSTLALAAPLLPEDAGSIKYQDLSFKFNFPTPKAGVLTLWGLGMTDGASSSAKTDSTLWFYTDDNQNDVIKQSMGTVGLSHKYFLKGNTFLKSTLATTSINTNWTTEKLDDSLTLRPYSKINNTNTTFILSSYINKKFNARHTNKTGIRYRGMMYDLYFDKAPYSGDRPQEISNASDFSSLIAAYTSSSINLSQSLVMNIGLSGQYFTLNSNYTLEPRVGVRKQLSARHALGLAYGLHSRLEKLNYYFNNSLTTGERAVNKNLDFTKAHHLVLSYDWNISELIHLRIEPYYQRLYSVPVVQDSSFSFLNLRDDLFFAEKLENTGLGENYGIDFTLEKYISEGFYYLATASLFNSSYRGGDGVWHSTRFNRNYVFNFLVGKEWQIGAQKKNVLSLNGRIGYQGGNRYSPVNEEASHSVSSVVYNEADAYSMQSDPMLNLHFTASYKINKVKSSHEIALKILNLTGTPDFNGHQYNYIDNTIDKDLASTAIPNLSYSVKF